MRLPSAIARTLRPAAQAAWRLSRGLTLGVRGLVFDDAARVLLVEHTYMSGWSLPGGGVERGETAEAALARELAEEAGVAPVGRPALVSAHANDARFPGDHVLVYRVEAWRPTRPRPGLEIRARSWFALDALPDDLAGPTRARLEEFTSGRAPSDSW